MHFKSLELFGFKSFANKTELNFEPGVTAIVGPNGCGKSNISDAIKWVLGETSAREVRGIRMEDVIFNGTDGKEALGFAEVSLTISNQPRILPTEYDEVTITRRVFRSGESEYFLNKSPVRLKDIAELFMGTGIGTSTYSLMEQGRIDQLLDSRPEERRHVFEEAAGITRYKSKKKEALRKLEQTEANLLRVSDVITEVKRQINSIERQANKARRYKEDFDRLKEMEILFSAREFRQIKDEEGGIFSDKDGLSAKEAESTSIMADLNLRLISLREDLSGIDHCFSDFKANLVDIEGQIQRNGDKQSYNFERISELNLRIVGLEKEIAANRLRALELEGEVSRLSLEAGSFKTNEERRKIEIEEKTIYLDTIAELIKACQLNIEKAKISVVDVAQGQSRVKNELTKLVANIQHLSARQRRIEVEKRKTEEESGSFFDKARELTGVVENASRAIEELNQNKARSEASLGSLENEISGLDGESKNLDSEIMSAESKLNFLEELKAKHEGFSLGVKSILGEAQKGAAVCEGVVGVLADLIEPIQGYDAAVEAALGEAVQTIVVKDKRTAKRLIEFLRENSSGRATFVSLEDLPRGQIGTDILNYVKANEEVKFALAYLLDGTYLAEDLESAFNAMSEKSERLKLVTKSGEVVEKYLSAGGKIPAAEGFGLVGRETKIKELRINIENFESKAQSLKSRLEEKNKEKNTFQSEITLIAEGTHKAQIELANRMSEKSTAEETVAKLKEEDSLLYLELEEVKSEIGSLALSEERFKEELLLLDQEDLKVQLAVKENQDAISHKLKEREDSLVLITQLKTELDSLKDREEALLSALGMMKRAFSDETTAIEFKQAQIEESRCKISELQIESEELVKINDSLIIEKNRVQETSQKIFEDRKKVTENIIDLESRIKQTQKEIDELKTQLNTLNVKSTEFNYKKSSLRDRLVQVYKVELDLDQIALPDDFNWDETYEKMAVLRSKLEQMGPVNLIAIEEHRELQDRYGFLTTQHQDLLAAKEDLHKAINRINRTTRELFLETFQKIQVEFRGMFRLLFNGGDSELMLIDQSDILESGIEIIARPPGKKPQSISLLSGGERSMTAIALLFAIFKVKPSPFCVLDEIDAALDESNIDRFCKVLKDFIKTSQFIMITHNKKTISVADVMYGITMEESGVSKIVSVRFSKEPETKTVYPVRENHQL
ncbi:MAG: chromosome segregation protein SMC [Candidatus Omnitrophota bacterium]